MKRVAIVAPHFIPSNLTSVHRSRLWSWYLKDYGWEPIIVTTHWDYYEESLDWELQELVPDDLRIIRTKAIPTKPVRVIGDIGVRSLSEHYRALKKLALEEEIDFVLITIPSNFSALLGRLIWRKYGIPYGIDYIDPWVHRWPGTEKLFSKDWISYRLGAILEPWAVKHCRLITGVADGYFDGVLTRNPLLRGQVATASMPYGISKHDFEVAKSKHREAYLLSDYRGKINIVYAGAMLSHGLGVLEKLLESISSLVDSSPDGMSDVRFHFIGTGHSSDDPNAFNIKPIAERHGLGAYVSEYPSRISYMDTLTHLLESSAILIVGSDQPHYTPSKVFQAIYSRKPIFAILHKESSGVRILRSCNAGMVIEFRCIDDIEKDLLKKQLSSFIRNVRGTSYSADLSKLGPVTARHSARILASQLDHVMAKSNLKGKQL